MDQGPDCSSEPQPHVRDYAQIRQSAATSHHIAGVCDPEPQNVPHVPERATGLEHVTPPGFHPDGGDKNPILFMSDIIALYRLSLHKQSATVIEAASLQMTGFNNTHRLTVTFELFFLDLYSAG